MGSIEKKWAIFVKSFIAGGGYKTVLKGLRNTTKIATLGLIIGIIIGTFIAVVEVIPAKGKLAAFAKKVCNIYVAFFRGTPMVVQLLLGYYVLFPLLGVNISSLNTCIIIFGLNSGAYVSEIMRSGILSVDVGQMEAGRAMGFGYAVTMWKIIVPQAVKNILPTIGNEFITLFKETSIVSFVGASDLFTAFTYMGAANYEYMIPYLVMAVIYIVCVMVIAFGVKLMEGRLRANDKR